MSEVSITPSALADLLAPATANLFGSIAVRKPIKIRVKERENASKAVQGNLYRDYSIKGFLTIKDYETAVNNAKERDGQERTFVAQHHKWAKHYKGSPLILVHEGKGRFYLAVRITKNTIGKSVYVDSNDNEFDYDTIHPWLLSEDRRETKRKSAEATAERQGVSVEDSVRYHTVPLDNIQTLVYQGTTYNVAADAEGAVTAKLAEQAEQAEQVQTP